MRSGRTDGTSRPQYQSQLNTIAFAWRSQAMLHSLITSGCCCWSHNGCWSVGVQSYSSYKTQPFITAARPFGLTLAASLGPITWLQTVRRRGAEGGRLRGSLVDRLLVFRAPSVTPAVPRPALLATGASTPPSSTSSAQT